MQRSHVDTFLRVGTITDCISIYLQDTDDPQLTGELRSYENDANDDAYYAFLVIPCIGDRGGVLQPLRVGEDWGTLVVLGKQPIQHAFVTWATVSRICLTAVVVHSF